jgi:hypothetical protein
MIWVRPVWECRSRSEHPATGDLRQRGARGTPHDQRPYQGRPCRGQGGVKLGGPRLPAMNETRQADALERARAIAILSELTGMSAHAVAAELNARQVETPSGAPWSAKTVIRARERLI